MRYLLFTTIIVIYITSLYYVFSILLSKIHNNLGLSIYKQCIFNFDYHKFDGFVIGRRPYTNKIDIKYNYKNYEYICDITDINHMNYISNTTVTIFAIPTTDTCLTCSNNKDIKQGDILNLMMFLVVIILLLIFSLINTAIYDFIVTTKIITESELYTLIINYIYDDYALVQQNEEDIQIIEIKLNIKCPQCCKQNSFYFSKQVMFGFSEEDCVICKENKSNVFLPDCRHVILCDLCVKLLDK